MREKTVRVFNSIIDYKDIFFIAIAEFLFVVLRAPSLVEPNWYGDEGIYQVVGQAINRGRILYEGIWDNKPPLLYFIYAAFDGDLFFVKLTSLIFGVLSIFVFYLLAKKLLEKKFSVYLSTTFFAVFFALPTLESNIANAENFMVLPILTAFYFALSNSKKKTLFSLISGILLSIAFLIKIVAIFDLIALLLSVAVIKRFEDFRVDESISKFSKELFYGIKKETILILSFLTPILLTGFYFLTQKAFGDFLIATFYQNIGYVGYGNDLLLPMGLLLIKLFILISTFILIIRFKKYIGSAGLAIFIWFSFSIFNVFFSQRPYPHYLMLLLPSLALVLGFAFEKKKIIYVTAPVLIIVVFWVYQSFNLNIFKSQSYYINYIKFMLGKKSIDEFQSYFDKRTPRDYEIANFINSRTAENESIFLWSDSGQIYSLTNKLPPGRFIVSYHITFYPKAIEETKKAIEDANVKYIVQTENTPEIKNFLQNFELRYNIDGANIYERQY